MKMIKHLSAKTSLSALALIMASSPLMAQELSLTLTNLTHGLHFTPIITAAHTNESSLFIPGTAASTELTAMAEGGSIAGLAEMLTAANANVDTNPAEGLLAPGMSTEISLSTDEGNISLSLSAMILPSNDGFVGLSNWAIPQEAGTYTILLNAYDAGTEANNELRGSGVPGEAGMPVPPPLAASYGLNGTGVTDEESNSMIHIHRGSIGDDELTSGTSDINNSVHRWLNPVAKLTITVQ